MLDLGPRARVWFALLFLGGELALIATAPLRPDRVFGFQMFNASSDIQFSIVRRVRDRRGRLVERPVPGGVWRARDGRGVLHRFEWASYLRGCRLWRTDARMHAKDGVDAQLFHLQRALDYVAGRIAGQDAQTVALLARVHAVRNGREVIDTVLQSAVR